jgi:hypothetical protein
MASGKIRTVLKFNGYNIVTRAVEEGVAYGVNRVFKYAPVPVTEEYIQSQKEQIETAVMNAICEVLEFGD